MAKKPKRKPAPKRKGSRRRKRGCPPGAIPITLTVDPRTNQTVADPPYPVHVSKNVKKQHVKWQSGKNFTVTFVAPKGSPFAKTKFTGGPGNPACSGYVVGAINEDYKYIAQVAGADPLDPIIHTDP